MVSGSSSVESLIPGSPGAIAAALENIGSGAAPAQQVAQAWQVMQLPGWQGSAGDAWRTFTPEEHGHLALAPGAFHRAAAAMLRYEGAFRVARAEAQAAVHDAAAAEKATAHAKSAYQDAVRKARSAPGDSPAKNVASFVDPGATALASAQARVAAAQRTLHSVGDDVASEIRSAARTVSGASSRLIIGNTSIQTVKYKAPPVIGTDPKKVREFARGVWDSVWSTVVGVKDLVMLLGGDTAVTLFTEGLPAAQDEAARENLVRFYFIMLMMQGRWDEIGKVIGNAAGEIGGEMVGLEHWQNGNPARGLGRIVGEIGLFVAAFAKIGKLGKLGEVGKASRVPTGTVDDFLPGLPKDAPPLLGKGPSVGRIVPESLTEQLAMTEARTRPEIGKVLPITLKDSRWPATEGWVKMQQVINGITIHYVRNTRTGEIDDFKFPH